MALVIGHPPSLGSRNGSISQAPAHAPIMAPQQHQQPLVNGVASHPPGPGVMWPGGQIQPSQAGHPGQPMQASHPMAMAMPVQNPVGGPQPIPFNKFLQVLLHTLHIS